MFRYVFPFLLLFCTVVNGEDCFCRIGVKTSLFEFEIGVNEKAVETFALPEKRLVDNICDFFSCIIESNKRSQWFYEKRNTGMTE